MGQRTIGRSLGDWLRDRVLAWLGLADVEARVRGIRSDMGPLESAVRLNAQTTRTLATRITDVGAVAGSADARLKYYENHVIPIRSAARTLREKWEREARRAEAAAQLAAGPSVEPPEMSEEVAGA